MPSFLYLQSKHPVFEGSGWNYLIASPNASFHNNFHGAMNFFSSTMNRLLGNVTVRLFDDKVVVDGVRAAFILKDIDKVFGTSRVSINMFEPVGRHSFSFHQFFLPDVLHVIDQLIETRVRGSRNVPIHTLGKIRMALLQSTWLKHVYEEEPVPQRLDKSALKDFVYDPLDFQREFFDRYEAATYRFNLKGYLFAGAAGSGKTLSSLMLTSQLGCDVVIVVSPNNALDRVWADTLATKLKSKPKYWISNSSTPPQRDVKYYVIHYEYLNKFKEQILPKLRYNNLGIILDESHNFNEVSSGRTERFIDLCRQTQCENVIWLSGTPIKAMAMEAVPLLRCIDPLFTPAVEDQFKKIFRGDNTKATAILNHRLGLVMFKVPKDRLKLEEPVFNQIQVSFPGSEVYTLEAIKKAMREFIEQRYDYYEKRQREDHAYFFSILEAHESSISRVDRRARQAYDLYRQELDIVVKNKGQFCADEMKSCNSYEQKQILPALSAEDRIRFKEVKTIYKYVHLKIQGECLGRVVGKARVDCHVEMAKHLDYAGVIESTQKKTVVFSSYVQVIEQASAQLQALEYSPAMVYAKTSHNLAQIVQTFGAVESVNPLIATYASLSTAVPLTMANAMILIDTPFRDYVLQQSVSRIHRIGADTQTFIYSAVLDTAGKPNISTRTSDILKWSQQQVAEITGVKSPYDLDVEALDGTAPSLESYSDRFDREVEQFNCCLEGLSEPVVAVSPPKSLSW